MEPEPDDLEVSSLIDGELPDGRLEELLRAAEADPRLQARITAYSRNDQRLRLAAAGGYDSDRPLPLELQHLAGKLAARLQPSPPSSRRRRLRVRLHGTAALLAAVALGWSAALLARPGVSAPDAFMNEAAEVHLAASIAPALDDPVDGAALAVLAEAFDRRVQPPDLRGEGLRLSEVDVVPTDLGPAVLFSYRGVDGQHYTLVLSFAEELQAGDSALAGWPQAAAHGAVAIYLWRGGGITYALVAQASAPRLGAIARRIARAQPA